MVKKNLCFVCWCKNTTKTLYVESESGYLMVSPKCPMCGGVMTYEPAGNKDFEKTYKVEMDDCCKNEIRIIEKVNRTYTDDGVVFFIRADGFQIASIPSWHIKLIDSKSF